MRCDGYLRAGDAEGEQIARAHPVDGALGDIEVLRGGGGDGGEGEPLFGGCQYTRLHWWEVSYIPTDDDIQQYQLSQPPEATLVDPVDRSRGGRLGLRGIDGVMVECVSSSQHRSSSRGEEDEEERKTP